MRDLCGYHIARAKLGNVLVHTFLLNSLAAEYRIFTVVFVLLKSDNLEHYGFIHP